jgi:hypothetical protein
VVADSAAATPGRFGLPSAPNLTLPLYGEALARTGDRAGATRMTDALALDVDPGHDPRGWRVLGRARIALALGERERAIFLLREAVARGVRVIPGGGRFTLHTDPALGALRGDRSLRPWLEPGR